MSTFIRKRALRVLRDILNNKFIVDDDGVGNGRRLTAVNKYVDAANLNMSLLPIVSIVPAPHTIQVGLLGVFMDSTYRIAIQGFVAKSQNEELFDAGEDVIEFITHELTKQENIDKMINSENGCFSIIEMGPILDEQFDVPGNIAYISIPLTIQFVER